MPPDLTVSEAVGEAHGVDLSVTVAGAVSA